MSPESVVENLCRIPIAFHGGMKSAIQLVAESGIDQCESALSVDAVAQHLARCPYLIEEWIRWSDDKRTSGGWYFLRDDSGYVVGSYPTRKVLYFSEATVACAEFVVREVQSIRA